FFHGLLRGLGQVSGGEDDFLPKYEALKEEALALLRAGAVTMKDVADLAARQPLAFGWDFLFVDEAQDWPENERDLLRFLYPSDRFVIADGVDQLVRGVECNWQTELAPEQTKTIF